MQTYQKTQNKVLSCDAHWMLYNWKARVLCLFSNQCLGKWRNFKLYNRLSSVESQMITSVMWETSEALCLCAISALSEDICSCPSAGDIEGPGQITRHGWRGAEDRTELELGGRAPLPLGYSESRLTSRHLARDFLSLPWLVLRTTPKTAEKQNVCETYRLECINLLHKRYVRGSKLNFPKACFFGFKVITVWKDWACCPPQRQISVKIPPALRPASLFLHRWGYGGIICAAEYYWENTVDTRIVPGTCFKICKTQWTDCMFPSSAQQRSCEIKSVLISTRVVAALLL